jgi:acyl-CoA reductase-like NAD-dependent aldehyde dehydrogenase
MYKIGAMVNDEKIFRNNSYEVFSPFSKEKIAEVFIPNEVDVERAIQSSISGFRMNKEMATYDRKERFRKFIELVDKNREKLSEIISLESGKPVKYSKKEVERAISTIRLGMELTGNIAGECMNLDITSASAGKQAIIKRFPMGIVLGITPFNFPLNLVAHKLVPALASGNSFIIKPASATPISSYMLVKYAIEAGFSNGMVQYLPLRGKEIAPLIKDDRIKKISFTGSADVGWKLKQSCGMKRISLELGGNGALVIEDVKNMELIIKKSITGSFAFSGQVCISIQRIYVNDKHYDEFIEKFVKETEKLTIGDPLVEATDIGPMIEEKETKRVMEWIDDGVKNGAKVLTGGRVENGILLPTIMVEVDEDDKLSSEEIFGPVVVVHRYSEFDEALRRVNHSKYGLQAGIYVDEMDKIMMAFNRLDVGGVVINDFPTFRSDNMPYGGIKMSGMGREGVKYAMEEMTERKVLILDNRF